MSPGDNSLVEHSEFGEHGSNEGMTAAESTGPGVDDNEARNPSKMNAKLQNIASTMVSGVASGTMMEEQSILSDAMKISVVSLLNQFGHPKVRGDFLSGQFACNINPEILPKLDELRCLLLPRWHSGKLSCNNRTKQAAVHFNKLLLEDNDLFKLSEEQGSLTYRQWMNTLRTIAEDQYWFRISPKDRCTHILPEEDVGMNKLNHDASLSPEPLLHKKMNGKFIKSSRKKSQMKVEEILVSSSGLSSSDGSTSSGTDENESSSESDSAPSLNLQYRKHKKYNLKNSDSRSVVTPPIFKMDGKMSLKEYLSIFESYFKNKFKGNSYDQTQMLAKFLSDDLLKVYEVRGGRKLKYNKMKEELLTYYKKLKIGGISYWRKQLKEATLKDDEGYDIFGMRIAELANLAYPKDKKESASQLRHCFLDNLPITIRNKITDAERTKKLVSGKKKSLPFSTLVQIAKDLQQSEIKPKSIMWASDVPEKFNKNEREEEASQPLNHTREFRNRRWSNDKPSTVRQRVQPLHDKMYRNSRSENYGSPNGVECTYCKRKGHLVENCWRASGLCLICGGNHFIEECSRYNPQYRSPSRGRQNLKPSLN